jgi:hypothetical protein
MPLRGIYAQGEDSMTLSELAWSLKIAIKTVDRAASDLADARAARADAEQAILDEMARRGIERFSAGGTLYERRPAFGAKAPTLLVHDCPEAATLDREADAAEERPAVAEAATGSEEPPYIGAMHKPFTNGFGVFFPGWVGTCRDPACMFPACVGARLEGEDRAVEVIFRPPKEGEVVREGTVASCWPAGNPPSPPTPDDGQLAAMAFEQALRDEVEGMPGGSVVPLASLSCWEDEGRPDSAR